jgi:uncharacterized protein (TIGR00369 family)
MEQKTYLPTYNGCLVCGVPSHNPHALNLRFQVTAAGVQTVFIAQSANQGYAGIVHGGIICAILDETLGWAVAVARKKFFVTGELNTRFLKPLAVGQSVVVQGRVLEHKSRYSMAEGEIVDAAGVIFATASGKFSLLKDEDSQKVDPCLNYKDDDLRILATEKQ